MKNKPYLTEAQEQKAMRNIRIVKDFGSMPGAIKEIVAILATKYHMSAPGIRYILLKNGCIGRKKK